MELCKFYLMDCCAKKDKCLYLHSDFPCKFYHTGLKCFQKDDCKFAHGKPLTNDFKNILLKHIETAPKEILGDFPRLSREGALNMVNAAQQKLVEQQKPLGAAQSPIPSLFDLTIPKPKGLEVNNKSSSKSSKSSSGVRKSRWCDSQSTIESPSKSTHNISPRNSQNQDNNYLSIQNLNGLLTPNQIKELTYLGITKLDELNQLTVKQLNELGITMIQINEIQLNALNIQKITSLKANNHGIAQDGKDLDLRIPPSLMRSDVTAATSCSKDVDMRYVPLKDIDKRPVEEPSILPLNKFSNENTDCTTSDENKAQTNEEHKAPVIDYSQYLKDSRLNLDRDEKKSDTDDRKKDNASHGKENHDESGFNNKIDNHDMKTNIEIDDKSDSMLGDYRNMNSAQIDQLLDSVVDDDEALQIDENLYSSDEQEDESKAGSAKPHDTQKEDNQKENTPVKSDTIANYLPEKSLTYNYGASTNYSLPGTSNISCELKSPESSNEDNAIYTPTIFDKRSEDVDLRSTGDMDMRVRNFGDTDLRQVRLDTDLRTVARDIDLRDNRSNSDVDLRTAGALDLPFKPVTQYTPASEIDGSITSHPPIVYKVFVVDVPVPDYGSIIRSVPQSQAATDPRLRKILKLSGSTAAADESTEVSVTPAAPAPVPDESVPKKPRVDPRKRKECIVDTLKINAPPKPSVLDIQVVLQTSDWYKELSTNQKIMVNQQLAAVSGLLKQFNQDKSVQKIFDLSPINSNPILCSILHNLGIYLTENGQFAYTKDVTMDITQSGSMSVNDSSIRGVGNSLMGPPLGTSCMNHMGMMPNMMSPGNFENRFQADPRMGTGLLGMAPNMPFDGYNPNGQYNNDNYGNYMNFGFNNEPNCDEDNYHYRNSNNRRGNRNQGGNGSNNMNNRNNNEHWANRPDRINGPGPRRNMNERGRGSNHRPRDRGGGPRKDKNSRK